MTCPCGDKQRIVTQPSGRVICEACGSGLLAEPPPKKARP